jgi:hypothetical protein
MRLALNMSTMAIGGMLYTTSGESKFIITNPYSKVTDEDKPRGEFAGQRDVTAAIGRRPAVVHENHTDVCLRCQSGAAKN